MSSLIISFNIIGKDARREGQRFEVFVFSENYSVNWNNQTQEGAGFSFLHESTLGLFIFNGIGKRLDWNPPHPATVYYLDCRES